jgi:heme-degrading monooxygenase HmoA
MTLEIVQWTAKEGRENDFEEAFSKAQIYLSQAEGYISHRFFKCIEESRSYVLLVEWSNLEAHTEQFRGSELYQQYRSLIKPYYEEGATLKHYDQIE